MNTLDNAVRKTGNATTDRRENRDWIADVGAPAFAAIREMVEALQCDYERLEELREELDGSPTDPHHPDYSREEREELADLESAAGDCKDEDEARQRIDEDPLSIELGGWWGLGHDPEPSEYRILLTTGGPAVRIVGDLGCNNEPASATLEVQDWFKPWTEYRSGDSDHDEVLMAYVECFYFGE